MIEQRPSGPQPQRESGPAKRTSGATPRASGSTKRGSGQTRRASGPTLSPTDDRARISLRVNGEERQVLFEGYKTLLEVLREDLDLTGTKHGCELGECGACAVLRDGKPVLSCLVLAVECDGSDVTTVEGLADGPALHPLQESFADLGAAQCGYCTPGILLTAKHLLDHNPAPTREEIKQALSGNLCRCTGYLQIFEAVEAAARAGAPAGRRADAAR
ncbi:MAG: (2Fe-2S)-binding protein [Gemmatimonadota bacterium]|jgi:carbon-monoxide dehydrogenase small subunit